MPRTTTNKTTGAGVTVLDEIRPADAVGTTDDVAELRAHVASLEAELERLRARGSYTAATGFADRCTDASLMVLRAFAERSIRWRNRQDPAIGDEEPWDPWRALRQRPETLFRWQAINVESGGAIVEVRDGVETIYLDVEQITGQRARAAALTHELIHLERGVPSVGCDESCRAAEEAVVRALTRRRMERWEKPDLLRWDPEVT